MSIRIRKQWFTIIEILLAIIIFGIGIMTLLRAIIFFVASGDEVKQKAIAILLAKEAMDVVYNQRDTNLRRSVRWDCAHIDVIAPEACAYRFEAWSIYRIEFNGTTWYTISDPAMTFTWSTGNQLYEHVANWVEYFSHEPSDVISPYARYVEFSPAVLSDTWMDTAHVLKATVYVQYIRGDANRKVVLESLLSAWEKDR